MVIKCLELVFYWIDFECFYLVSLLWVFVLMDLKLEVFLKF